MYIISLSVCCICANVVFAQDNTPLNYRPIIGILGQKPPDSILDGLEDKNYTSYIAASYVKKIESAGARAVPILTYQDDEYYQHLAKSLNGFLFPGGSVSITNSSGYGAAGQIIYDHVLSANAEGIYLPLWGTCLGFEMLTYLANNNTKILKSCNAQNKADPLILQAGFEDSRIFEEMPLNIAESLTTEQVTINFHKWCVTPQNFTDSGLSNDYHLLSTSYDSDGLEYVSLIEHKTLPIFGSQFHPEKNPFEWANDEKHNNIPHTRNAIEVTQYFANFFVSQARLNNQSFVNETEEEDSLIYNYDAFYTAKIGSSFTQVYLFR